MAIYHLSAQVFSRGAGHSAVHAAAYRARANLTDERTGLKHDYSRKAEELLFEGIYAPKDAPEWTRDRQQLWNHVEAFEKRRDAQLAREFNIALPWELTLEQNRYALQDWIRDNFTRKGLIADAVIHAPSADGDERNMHAHVMVVLRKLDGTEFAAKKERAESIEERKDELEALRESWERIGNRHLERHGYEPTLDRRSLLDQGIEREPSVHMGKSATAIEREGKPSELGDVNREISADNERKVIDLGAERAMREAREAAQGRVDEIRPDSRPSSTGPFEMGTETPRAAAGREEAPAAPSAPPDARMAPGEPQGEAEAPKTVKESQRELRENYFAGIRAAAALDREQRAADRLAEFQEGKAEAETRRVVRSIEDAAVTPIIGGAELFDKVTHAAHRLVDAVFKPFAAAVEFLGNMFAPPPPMTRDQAERAERVADEKQQHAEELAAYVDRKANLDEILQGISRDDAERLRQRRERGDGDEVDRGRERER
jgi:ATP-dependent exoDNAse (exonuclease V) alpha subunit